MSNTNATSIDPEELARFERYAHRWWDANGPYWPIHSLNAFRLSYVRDRLSAHFGRDPTANRPLTGLRLLDVGCGGGILSESVASLGAEVIGIDVVEKNVRVAQIHAEGSYLNIDYRLATVESLADEDETFDAVLNMEVVEHVDQLHQFLGHCGTLVRPGGAMVVSTINRTVPAYFAAIIAVEYVLNWLPKGTHHWRKLVRPTEVVAGLGDDFDEIHRTGVRVNPFDRSFHFTRYMGINYMMVFGKKTAP